MLTTTSPLRAYIRSLLLCLIPGGVGIFLVLLARLNPLWTERIYARTLFPFISFVTGLPGRLPFSVAGCIIWGGVLLALVVLLRLVVLLVRRNWRALATYLQGGVLLASCLLLAFALTCAPNYHRLTFTELSGLSARPSTSGELAALCVELIDRANAGRQSVALENGLMASSPDGFPQTSTEAKAAFDALSADYPFVGRALTRPKPMPLSQALSHLRLTGFYFSYTGEANVNAHMPPFELGFTMCHELAHTRGFMREDEANFIAYLACRKAASPSLAYSGHLSALNYSMSALYGANPELYFALRKSYSDGVNADLAALGQYWSHYETPAATVSNAVNDLYLRTNDQTDGTRSYGRMVDLLLADYRLRHGLN